MLYGILKTAHLLAIIVWIGGMVYTRYFLGPAAASLDPETRARLMQQTLGRFFRVVTPASAIALVSGVWMLGRVAKGAIISGNPFSMPLEWAVMAGLGFLMVGIYLLIRFVLYKRLVEDVGSGNWDAAGKSLSTLRNWVGTNMLIGLIIVVVMGVGIPR